jgi:hypothetical protein
MATPPWGSFLPQRVDKGQGELLCNVFMHRIDYP